MTRCHSCGTTVGLLEIPNLTDGSYCSRDEKSGTFYYPKPQPCCQRQKCGACWHIHFREHAAKGIKYVKCVSPHKHGEPEPVQSTEHIEEVAH